MTASTAIADSPLRQAGMRLNGMPAGGLALPGLNILIQVCLGREGLHAPVSPGDCAISSRTVMDNAR
jgi:hypothetical protein